MRINTLIKYSDFLFSAGIAVAIFFILAGPTGFWSYQPDSAILSAKHGLAIGLLMCAPALFRAHQDKMLPHISTSGFLVSVCLVFFSDWLCRPYSLLQGPSIRGELILGIIATTLLLRSGYVKWFTFFLFTCIAICIGAFFKEAGGQLLFSDDHATFFFRLSALKENFPYIPFYSPSWNGGFDARDFFATGALNAFFIFAPFIYFFDLSSTYNLIIALTLFILVPGCAYLAAYSLGFHKRTSALAAVLALSSSLLWYRWALCYGTIGFVISTGLLILNLALLSKITDGTREISRGEAILFVLSLTLMALWPASAITILPVAVIAIVRIFKILRKRYVIPTVTALVVINIGWMLMFWSVSNVGKFIHSEQSGIHSTESGDALKPEQKGLYDPTPAFKMSNRGINLKRSLRMLREAAKSANPLIVCFLLPGILLLKGNARLVFGTTALWLLFIGTVLAPVKPQLELDRMLIILLFLGSIPAALCLDWLLNNFSKQSILKTLPAALCLSIFIISPLSVGSMLLNRTLEQYKFVTPLVNDMANAIKSNTGDGRFLFSGCLLHEIGGGHAAPFWYFTGKPIIASTPFHNIWRYKQIFPKSFISRGDTGILEYLDLYNVTAVMSHEKNWRLFFAAHPDKFKQVWENDRFALFKRVGTESKYTLEGAAQGITQNTSSITLTPLTESLIIKFNYFPFITADNCEVSPYQYNDEVTFIRLTSCQVGKSTRISSVSPLRRLMLK